MIDQYISYFDQQHMVSKNGWQTYLINSFNEIRKKIFLRGIAFHKKYAARMAVLEHLGAKNFKIQIGIDYLNK